MLRSYSKSLLASVKRAIHQLDVHGKHPSSLPHAASILQASIPWSAFITNDPFYLMVRLASKSPFVCRVSRIMVFKTKRVGWRLRLQLSSFRLASYFPTRTFGRLLHCICMCVCSYCGSFVFASDSFILLLPCVAQAAAFKYQCDT